MSVLKKNTTTSDGEKFADLLDLEERGTLLIRKVKDLKPGRLIITTPVPGSSPPANGVPPEAR